LSQASFHIAGSEAFSLPVVYRATQKGFPSAGVAGSLCIRNASVERILLLTLRLK
jgi:hypothetical protein